MYSAPPTLLHEIPMPKHGLDAQGVRELLAGHELELGDERARAASEKVRADLSEGREAELRKYAEQMHAQAIWLPLTVGGLSLFVGFGAGVLFEKIR